MKFNHTQSDGQKINQSECVCGGGGGDLFCLYSPTCLLSEPVWHSGKALGWLAEGLSFRIRFGTPLSSHSKLWSMDTPSCDFVPRN